MSWDIHISTGEYIEMARQARGAAPAQAGANGTLEARREGPRRLGGTYPVVELGGGLTARLMTITPRLAAEWLEKSPRVQRTLGRTAVEMIARAQTEGGWKLNGATVVFGSDGRLYDGQHRLAACVLSGVPIVSLVAWGVDPDAFDTMDVGKGARTAADALTAAGYGYASSLAAAAQFLYRLEHGLKPHDKASRRHRVRLSPAEVHRFVEDRPALRRAARRAQPSFRRLGLCGVSVAAYYAFDRVDAAAAEAFFEGLSEGMDLPRGSPILALRARAERHRQGERWGAVELWWHLVTAWNAWRRGESIEPKGWRYREGEPLPVPA